MEQAVMRFNKVEEFTIDELLLDEGNYRFSKAEDQKACVQKIYAANAVYFKGLMKSIAEDDLGEPLLVFQLDGDNIVSDGNRRLSALKVLHSDEYAPTDAIEEYAKVLRSTHEIDFKKIQAQVSADKSLISRTVYERHSSGNNGTNRIPWNAYAAARFGFDEKLGDHKEWRIMALLSEVETKYPTITSFTGSSDFSYEVFRRLIRSAIRLERISENIFSERGERIKKTARKDLIKDAVSKAYKFLQIMKKKEITLSRTDGIYADKDNVDKYVLKNFALSPDNQTLANAKSDTATENPEIDTEEDEETSNDGEDTDREEDEEVSNDSEDTGTEEQDTDDDTAEEDDAPEIDAANSGHGVDRSDVIENKLKRLRSNKLIKLYNSLCTVSLRQHPELMYVGAWMFFEILAKQIGNVNAKTGNRQSEFAGFFSGKMNTWSFQKQIREECFAALKEIQEHGNMAKHSIVKTRATAIQLRGDFEVLEPLIIAVLDDAIAQKKKAK